MTLDWIFPFDSFEMEPIEYKLPRAAGSSVPPKITEALSLIETASEEGKSKKLEHAIHGMGSNTLEKKPTKKYLQHDRT